MNVERHDMHEEDVGAYLLRALTEVEEQRFEIHLGECPLCQDEVVRLRPVADALSRSVMPVAPPAHLKASLMAAVEADVREREEAEGAPRRRRRRSLAGRRRRGRAGKSRTSGRPAMAWVAASTTLLVGIIGGAGGFFAIAEAIKDPEKGSRTVAAAVDKTRLPQGSGSLVVPENPGDGAVLRVQGLPDLEQSSVYQVWLMRRHEVISQSLFVVGEDGEGAAGVADDLEGAEAVLVTRENAGGAKAPSEEPVLRVAL